MSTFDSNYGEHDERDILEAAAYELELAADEDEHVERERVDRLRRDDPVFARAALAKEDTDE